MTRSPGEGGGIRGVPDLPMRGAGSPVEVAFLYQDPAGIEQSRVVQAGQELSVSLRSGDRCGLTITPAEEAFVYVCQWDQQGYLTILFPHEGYADFVNPLRPGETYRLPAKQRWFYLDKNTGVETITAVAARSRWSEVEELFQNYPSASSEEKAQAAAEIRRLLSRAAAEPTGERYGLRFTFQHE